MNPEAEILKLEVSELESLLNSVRGETKNFLVTCESSANSVPKRVTQTQKLAAAHSAWARSGVRRTVLGPEERRGGDESVKWDGVSETKKDVDLTRAERAIKTRSAAYSIGVRYKDNLDKNESSSRPLFYDVNDNVSSTRKRTKAAHIMGTVARPPLLYEGQAQDPGDTKVANKTKAIGRNNNNNDCEEDEEHRQQERTEEASTSTSENDGEPAKGKAMAIRSQKYLSGHAYSFPKGPRAHSPAAATSSHSAAAVRRLDDVEKAANFIRPNVAGPVWKPEVARVLKERLHPSEDQGPAVEPENDAAAAGAAAGDSDASNSSDNENETRKNNSNRKKDDVIDNLDVLSNHIRAPGAIIRPDSSRGKRRNPILAVRNKGNPGPGAYAIEKHYAPAAQIKVNSSGNNQDEAGASASVSAGAGSSKRGRSQSPGGAVKPAVAAVRAQMRAAATMTPGPGAYDLTRADSLMKYDPPCAVNMGKGPTITTTAHGTAAAAADGSTDSANGTAVAVAGGGGGSESQAKKTNSLLEQKRYWEEKARDARDDHDHMKIADISILRPRTPTAMIHGDRSSGIDFKNRRIIRERIAEREREAQGRVYDVDYSVVEQRPKVKVSMAAEAASRKSLREKILDKPAIAKIRADKIAAEKARDRFYGPNLPVAWGDEDLPAGDSDNSGNRSRSRSRSRERTRRSKSQQRGREERGEGGGVGEEVSSGSSGDESPTEEVLRLLGEKRPSKEDKDLVSDTAYAYLRSSYAGGARSVQKSAIMREDTQTVSRKQAILAAAGISETDPTDFIGPQLQVDWASELESRSQKHKAPALSMSAALGRDELVVYKKGEKLVKKFVEPIRFKDGALGPGIYNTGGGFGEDVAGGVVAFDKIVSRQDLVGPYGERPSGAKDDIADVLEDELYRGQRLDFDFADAKDRNPKQKLQSFKLYREDRYPDEKEDEKWYLSMNNGGDDNDNDHLGGSWFEGMADAVHKRPALVRMDKMVGRLDLDKKEEDYLIDEELAPHGLAGEEKLDLDVKEWNLRMNKTPVTQFKDPNKYPRFDAAAEGKRKEEEERSPLNPNFDYLLPRKRDAAAGAIIDMSKQLGRHEHIGVGGITREQQQAGDQERRAMESELGGAVDETEALALARDRDTAQARAAELTGRHKRILAVVDMSKQRGRDEEKENNRNSSDSDNDDGDGVGKEFKPLPNDWVVDNKGGGGSLWTKAQGRDEGGEDLVDIDPVFEREELDLDPDHEAHSRFKKAKGAAAWQSAVDIPRFPPSKQGNGGDDHLTDEDMLRLLEDDNQAQGQGPGAAAPNHVTAASRILHKQQKQSRITMTKDDTPLPNHWDNNRGDGAVDWSKAAAGAAVVDGKDIDPILEEQALDIQPDERASSSFRKVKSGPSWVSTSGIDDGDGNDRNSTSVRGSHGNVGDRMAAILKEMGLGHDGLDIDDVDSGKFLRGKAPITDAGRSATAVGSSYARQSGRKDVGDDDKIVRESLASEGLQHESELDRRPDLPAAARRRARPPPSSYSSSSGEGREGREKRGGGGGNPPDKGKRPASESLSSSALQGNEQENDPEHDEIVFKRLADSSRNASQAADEESDAKTTSNNYTTRGVLPQEKQSSDRDDDKPFSPKVISDDDDEPVVGKGQQQQRTGQPALPPKLPAQRRGVEDFDKPIDRGDKLEGYLDRDNTTRVEGGDHNPTAMTESQNNRPKSHVSFSVQLEEFSSPPHRPNDKDTSGVGVASSRADNNKAVKSGRSIGKPATTATTAAAAKAKAKTAATPPVIRAVPGKGGNTITRGTGIATGTSKAAAASTAKSTTASTDDPNSDHASNATTTVTVAPSAPAPRPSSGIDMDDIFALAEEPSPPRIRVPAPSGTGPPSLSNAKKTAAGAGPGGRTAATNNSAAVSRGAPRGGTVHAERLGTGPGPAPVADRSSASASASRAVNTRVKTGTAPAAAKNEPSSLRGNSSGRERRKDDTASKNSSNYDDLSTTQLIDAVDSKLKNVTLS